MWFDSELLQLGNLELRGRKSELGQYRLQLKQRARGHRVNTLILRFHQHCVQQGRLCSTDPLTRAVIGMILPCQMHELAS